MKKVWISLTLAVVFFGFSTGAFAQWDVCEPCPDCTVATVVYPAFGPGEPGACGYFDYETGYGYTSGYTGVCRAIIDICNCENAGINFVAGHRIGIKMTILVNGLPGQRGAYWSAPADADIEFAMYSTTFTACAATSFPRNFGPGKFFKVDDNGSATIEVTSLAGDPACEVPIDNQATQIVTNPDQGYTITTADEAGKLSRWVINIPEIRADPDVLNNCDVISVKVETLDQALGGICPTCASTCECEIDVANVCCTSCTYEISPTHFQFSSAGNTGTVDVTTSLGDCPWNAASNASWITVTPGSSGNGNGTVSYSISPNTEANSRSGTITIAWKTFTVTQEAKRSGLPWMQLLLCD